MKTLLWCSVAVISFFPIYPPSGTDCVQPARFGKRLTRQHPAVVKLDGNGSVCTGTLVGPTLVLTAAHCMRAGLLGMRATFHGGGVGKVIIYVLGGAPFPDRDLALLLLAKTAPVDPIGISLVPPQPHHTLAFVGYGCRGMCLRPDGDPRPFGSNRKRRAVFPAAGFSMEYRSDLWWLCPGDSGGPVIDLDTGKVVAVGVGFWARGQGMLLRFSRMRFENPRAVLRDGAP